jgi:predicted small secreted protein
MSKRQIFIMLTLFTLIPFLIWFKVFRTVDAQKIIDNLHLQFDNISFISLDYQTDDRKLLGMKSKVINGVIHVGEGQETTAYNIVADAYTGEIMEITNQ